nr:bromodomain-containing protein 8 [Salvelinus alpinus]
MASGVGKHKLLSMGPTEPWSVREKLCLATSVMKSGDQNWVSVSRAIKPFAEPGRPPDWFSQKHCASQYSELLETTETPKRKRGEKGEVVETVEDVIVRRLTAERIDELKRLIKDTQEKHRKLKTEAELIQAGHLDSKLEDLWGEIVQKKKQEQDEADVKRKVTDAAYLARQAVKNTPKRVPSVTVRSPLGCGSPSLEFCQGDTPQSTPEDPSTSVTAPGVAGFMPLTEACGLGGAESGLGTLLDESPQKKLLGQKATPPPSPLLSELLKKGSLLPTSPRLVGDGDLPGNMTIAHDLQLTGSVLLGSLATGAPTLSRLLEAGPQFSTPLDSLASSTDSSSVLLTAASPPTMDSPASLHTGGNEVGASQPGPGDGTEEDLVTVSYMAEELDLETVGDIIAIIEDKGDENTEALDAAAVEAALSLCEETGHALSGHWEPGPFKSPESDPSGSSHLSSLAGSLEVKREVLQLRGGTSACDSQDNCPSGYPHPLGISGLPSSSCSSMMLEHSQAIGARLQPGAMGGADGEGSPVSPHATIRCESEEWTQQGAAHADSEDGPMTRRHSKMQRDVLEQIQQFLATQLIMQTSESGVSAKSLRGRESTRKQDPSDKVFCSLGRHGVLSLLAWPSLSVYLSDNLTTTLLSPHPSISPPPLSLFHPRPMDLSTIKKNIETGLIRTTAEFQRDIMLMFQNAVMYNSCDHDVFHMALEMQRDVLEQIQQFLATQLIMQTSESGVSAKSLRGRESTRKQDPSDKDSVPMASPAFLLSLFDGGTRGRRCAIEADLKMKK